ncbi:hypothetical protein GUJ93_ZPchr0006g42916 [Zizania palustris]|uniref:Uncharacterized protein n=1 Tax=Zizania palustris TaxID=103762 RepID=A0A8J5W1M5_ZIZPA|nr:hypothetical protein GUJ93_ZPchr0006g42916 [Zizania palustris]
MTGWYTWAGYDYELPWSVENGDELFTCWSGPVQMHPGGDTYALVLGYPPLERHLWHRETGVQARAAAMGAWVDTSARRPAVASPLRSEQIAVTEDHLTLSNPCRPCMSRLRPAAVCNCNANAFVHCTRAL